MINQDLFIGDKVVDTHGKEYFRGDNFDWVYPIKLYEAPADWAIVDSIVEIKGEYKLLAKISNDDEFNATQIKRW